MRPTAPSPKEGKMKRSIRTAAILTVMLLVTGLFSLRMSGTAAEQTQGGAGKPSAAAPARQLLSLTVVQIKPELLTEWREFQLKESIPTLKKGGSMGREAYTTAVFGHSFEYVFVTPIPGLEQYDAESPIVKALGQEGAQAYGAKNRRFVASSRTYAIQTRPDLSYVPTETITPALGMVTLVDVVPGRNVDFENLIKSDVIPAMKKAQVARYTVSQIVYGGNINGYVSVVAYGKFAEIGKGHPFEQALGADGTTKLNQKTAGIIQRVERIISRYVPELSFSGAGTSSD
jgi:hypothetical protein